MTNKYCPDFKNLKNLSFTTQNLLPTLLLLLSILLTALFTALLTPLLTSAPLDLKYGTLYATYIETHLWREGQKRFGNAIGPYWASLATAHLLKVDFQSGPFKIPIARFFPLSFPALHPFNTNQSRLFEPPFMCKTRYSHLCPHWPAILPMIQSITRFALDMEHLSNSPLQADQAAIKNAASDIVIQFRCDHETILDHPEYGPIHFSFYDPIPLDTPLITIVSEPMHGTCNIILNHLKAYLLKKWPNTTLNSESGTIYDDFARLVTAKTLFKAMGSFGLWAAAANPHQVYSLPLYQFDGGRFTFPAPNWIWSHAPVLLPGTTNLDKNDIPGILRWLEF